MNGSESEGDDRNAPLQLHQDRHPALELNSALTCSQNSAQALLALSAMRGGLLADISKIQKQQEEMTKSMKSMVKKVEELSTPGALTICAACKQPTPPHIELERIEEAVLDGHMIAPMVQLYCILTALSFARRAPNGHQIIPANYARMFEDKLWLIEGASGFSTLFFAIRGNKKKILFQTNTGRLWAFFVRESMAYAFIYANMKFGGRESSNELENSRSRDVTAAPALENLYGTGLDSATATRAGKPFWMEALADSGKARKSINVICTKMEMLDSQLKPQRQRGDLALGVQRRTASGNPFSRPSPPPACTMRVARSGCSGGRASSQASTQSSEDVLERRPKRARVGSSPASARYAIELDLDERYRQEAVRFSRGKWTEFLNSRRTHLRFNLLKNLMFLRHIIEEKFESAEALANAPAEVTGISLAARAGYEYVFDDRNVSRELRVPSDFVENGIWKIPGAKIVSAEKARNILDGASTGGSKDNLDAVNELRKNFSSLTVVLRYKREVRRRAGTTIGSFHPQNADRVPESFMFQVSEKVSLHHVALSALTERFRARDDCAFLALSPLSVRTVHIVAIALRALLRSSLGMSLTRIEEIALGNAVHRSIGTTEDLVTTRMEDGVDGGKKVMLSGNEISKLTMSYDDWLRATRGRDGSEGQGGEQTCVSDGSGENRASSITSDQGGPSGAQSLRNLRYENIDFLSQALE